MLVDAIISAGAGALVTVITFVVIKGVVLAQSTGTWTAAEYAVISNIPVILGLVGIIGMFSFLTVRRMRGNQ